MKKADKEKLSEIYQALENSQTAISKAKNTLKEVAGGEIDNYEVSVKAQAKGKMVASDNEEKIIEGVFDGQNMIGPDGKQYTVPANYASKSKLVEGDILKLTISGDGTFVYKQIGPVERRRMVGVLIEDDEDEGFRVDAEGKIFKVLTASVTYFKGDLSDEVVILVPEEADSRWAAIENVIKNVKATERGIDT